MPQTTITLESLFAQRAAMGGQAELSLQWAADTLHRPGQSALDKIAQLDRQIDLCEQKIYDDCMRFVTSHAADSRAVHAAFAISRFALHLERIGDYAKNIVQRAEALTDHQLPAIQGTVWRMAQTAARNLNQLLNAILQQNAEAARLAWHADADLDAHYTSIVLDIMPVLGQRPQAVVAATHLWFIARNLERIGDHQSNMAEALYYWLHGKRLDEKRRFYDSTAQLTSSVQTPLDAPANINSNTPLPVNKLPRAG